MNLFVVILTAFLSSSLALAKPNFDHKHLPHLDLEMTGAEYHNLMLAQPALFGVNATKPQPIDEILQLGKRNMEWLAFMNEHRSEADQIHLTKPGQLTGIPIDNPRKYSEQTVLNDYQNLQNQLPTEMAKVLLYAGNFTQDPPIELEQYITWAKKVDRLYQSAARWLMMKPYLNYLAGRKAEDVRGIYYFNKMTDVKSVLEAWTQQPEEQKKNYRQWLLSMCYNSKGVSKQCESELKNSESKNEVYSYYKKYLAGAIKVWNRFFNINDFRSDVDWRAGKMELMQVPFAHPKDQKIYSFLKDNIEDEFRWENWRMTLNFVNTNDFANYPHIVFEAGATPNVDRLAGNRITMDKNANIDEWDVQWTIRHEFGHVLGLPDCYVEFYEASEKVIVSYQLDITNFMCSRAGKLKALHYEELKKSYKKGK